MKYLRQEARQTVRYVPWWQDWLEAAFGWFLGDLLRAIRGLWAIRGR